MESVSNGFTIDLRRLQVLRELRQRETVAATAGALHLTPSAVSQQLAALAKEVGAPLIERQGRGVRLTGQAHVLLEHADILYAQLERARSDLAEWQEGAVGTVRIGALSTAITGIVAPAMASLTRDRPRLRLQVREVEGLDSYTRLDTGELDIALTVDDRSTPTRADPRFHRLPLLADPLDAALPPDHPLATRRSIALTDLAEQPWIVGAPGGTCYDVAMASCANAGFRPDVRHHCNDWEGVCALVAAGAGVALVPRLATTRRNDAIALRPVTPETVRQVRIAVRTGSECSPILGPVIEALQRAAREPAKLLKAP
ncbi:MAG TPA: LysR family transcriptional regulator [Mycobacteriales bacterium]|jgi:DNA-binding transcriptional LysR family regulator|nr:LysR family transcriptional regulator [Mycobacteriales bacterium]